MRQCIFTASNEVKKVAVDIEIKAARVSCFSYLSLIIANRYGMLKIYLCGGRFQATKEVCGVYSSRILTRYFAIITCKCVH